MAKEKESYSALPLQTFKRLPGYYNYLQKLKGSHTPYVSAAAVARDMGQSEVQVRKDLAAVSKSPGIPRKGFVVEELFESIGECLGYHNRQDAVLVGAGHLGRALMAYKGFEDLGVRIVVAFDRDEALQGTKAGRKKIFPMEKLPVLCKRLGARIGIITVPATEAQKVCDALVESGILAIWNFAPTHLQVPEGVLVQNENMATSLALLSQHLAERMG